MTPKRPQNILAEHSSEGPEGRAEEAEKLYLAAISGGGASHIRVKGTPGAGVSELLKQACDRLFSEQRFVIPFYFALRREDRTAREAANRFGYEFLLQAIAFRRNDPQLIATSPDVRELRKLAPLPDADWVNAICESLESGDSSLRAAIASPLRAAIETGLRVCVIADGLHNAAEIEGGREFVDCLSQLAASGSSTVILASRRNYAISQTAERSFFIDRPSIAAAAAIADKAARDLQVDITESVRDLVVAATGRRPGFIRSIVSAARDSGIDLTSYRNAARIYSSEITEGSIARSMREEVGEDPGLALALASAASTNAPFKIAALGERLGIGGDELRRLTDRLASSEIIDVAGETARISGDSALRDYLSLGSGRITRTAAAANIALRFLGNSPSLMAREYRREAAVGLRELLSAFDGRQIPRAAIDYRTFRDGYKGLSDAEIRTQLPVDVEQFTLPQIVQTSALADFAPQFADQLEPERSVAGVGFSDRSYRTDDEIVWIAAELDSKLEADPELVREWIERLDEAASQAGFARHRIWLVTPEGFSPGALELLAERGGIGSSRRQLGFLRAIVQGDVVDTSASEYEMVIPIGDETELIAVHAVEEVARRASFPAKAINQIKTALIEACINASEHSLSPDAKIYLKFASFDDRLVLTVSNRGLRLGDRVRETSPDAELSTDTRRGWGLGLMRNLMDDVRVESVDDGTRIAMTKLLPME
ncbi:MAG: ATP-binding protein [Pyrinomonadaceae bacterium]